jgi:hypothetical protein
MTIMTPMRIQLLQEQAHMSGNFMGHFLVDDVLLNLEEVWIENLLLPKALY